MPRLGLGLGLNLPRPIFLGRSPSEPTGFVAKYTAYLVDNFTLVTGDSVNVWADESVNNNDLTQATSANQPKLVEDNTLTQFTASNQPTLIDDAGTWKAEFDTNDFMEGLKSQSGNFTYVFTGVDIPNHTTINSRFIGQLGVNTARFINLSGSFRIYDDVDTIVFQEPWNNESEIIVRLSGNTLSVFMNGTQLGSDTDVTGSTFTTLTTLGNSVSSINGTLQSLEIYDVAVADVTNITETPVQTLTADPLKMRTSANANPTDGQDVAKWYADEFSAYRDARVVFDTDDNMSGLPALTGDWSYMIDTSINTLGTTKYLLEQTAGSSAILALADNYMYLRDTTGANDIALTSYTITTSRTQFGFVRSGNDLLYYVNGVLKETVDVTGRTFDFGAVGKNATSADMDTKQIIPFDRALTQEEIGYYSYLRSETGEILLPPLLPS